MSRYRGNDMECPYCGMKYVDFRCQTFTSFQEVKDSLWRSSDNPDDWRYKRKGTVLGLWHMTKKHEWEEHIRNCELQRNEIKHVINQDFICIEEY